MRAHSLIQIRKLTVALIISGSLNVVLAGLFFYWFVKEQPPLPYFEKKPARVQEQQQALAMSLGNSELIEQYSKLPFEALKEILTDGKLAENGLSRRDLALACMVAFHHFDLERALARWPLPSQKKMMSREGQTTIYAYPGLTQTHFNEIAQFLKTERWPFKSKGLFLRLQQPEASRDPSLVDAFLMTPEFLAVQLLFTRSEQQLDREELLNMLLEGDWQLLSAFTEKQKLSQDLSNGRRQRLLLDYIEKQSSRAAYLLLKMDGELASQRLDDAHVLLLLHLTDQKTAEAEKFAQTLLTSPRSDAIWQAAAAQLYRYAGEPYPEKYQHHAALKRFVSPQSEAAPTINPEEKPVKKTAPPQMQTARQKTNPSSDISSKPILPKQIEKKALEQVAPKQVTPPLPNKKPLISSVPHKLPTALKSQERTYTVQEGDSLWKIAKKFNVDVEKLRTHNQLESETLQPGKIIRIPS